LGRHSATARREGERGSGEAFHHPVTPVEADYLISSPRDVKKEVVYTVERKKTVKRRGLQDSTNFDEM
jgi:hypothetical protein